VTDDPNIDAVGAIRASINATWLVENPAQALEALGSHNCRKRGALQRSHSRRFDPVTAEISASSKLRAKPTCTKKSGDDSPRVAGEAGSGLSGIHFGLAGVTVVIVLAICATAWATASSKPLGSSANEVWVLRPTGRVRSIVVFGHGWSTPFPSEGFAAWIAHLRARGSIVIYPRYRVSADASTASALAAFHQGIVTAFRSLGATHVPIVALGKSFGASAVFYYAAEAQSWGVPTPAAVISIFPALPIDGSLPTAPLPASDEVEIFVGDADSVAGSAGANAFWQWLLGHPSTRKRYIVVHSRPGFVADHNSAQRSDPTARVIFWRPVDALIAAASSAQGSK
jgi:hypothetical protein